MDTNGAEQAANAQPDSRASTTNPEKHRPERARRALSRFWVAGTAGAFLTALSRNLPLDLETATLQPNPTYTLDLVNRYLYVLFLLAYFFISWFSSEQDGKEYGWSDLGYDVLQSIAGLCSVFCLGFVTRGEPRNWLGGYLAANSTILIISGLSLFFNNEKTPKINRLRKRATAISLIAWIFAVTCCWLRVAPSMCVVLIFLALQLFLFFILGRFFESRWRTAEE